MPILVSPPADTTRGGALVSIARPDVYDVTRDNPLTSAGALTLTSGRVTFSAQGVELDASSGTAATYTELETSYELFDLRVTAELLTLTGDLRVEHEGAYIGVNGRQQATGRALTGDPAEPEVTLPRGGLHTLRLVRTPSQVFGFVDGVLIVRGAVPSSGGTIVLAARSGGLGRMRDFTVRSGATINGELLADTSVYASNVLVGAAPPSSSVGDATLEVFGLFGSESSSSVFDYTYPTPRTVATEVVRTLRTYQDPAVRD